MYFPYCSSCKLVRRESFVELIEIFRNCLIILCCRYSGLIFSHFQLISLPSTNDRGVVSYNFGLSAEEGGANKQGRTDFLSSTSR